MKKRLLLFLIASSLCTCSADAAVLKPAREARTLMELAAATPAPRPKITDIMKNGFFYENGKIRYYRKGRVHKGFLDLEGKRYYLDEDGEMVTGSQTIEGDQYHFDSNGVMETGFVKIRSKKYYYDEKTGKKVFNARKIGAHKYYFRKNTGEMVTGFFTQDLKGSKIRTYYDKNGHLKTGTFFVSNVEYEASATGEICSVKNRAKIICQRPELPTGCEITSWTMMAVHAGIQMDKIRAADLMPKSSDPNKGFVGDPHSSSGGSLVIYPGGLEDMTERYLGSYVDMTDCSMEDLKEKLWDQHLVLIWVTRLDGFGSHTVALTGYDQDSFYYNDPWTGAEGQISNDELRVLWGENGHRAMSY